MALQVDVISDIVCPWCFVGKRKLERAFALFREQHPGAEAPKVLWRPFQLNPDLPESGIARDEYVRCKFGGRGDEIYARVAEAGRGVGIAFAFDRVVRQPNTLAAHSLIALAEDSGKQDEVVEAFFRAHFIEGRDLTSNDELANIASGAGLAREEVESCLASAEARSHVQGEDEEARRIGVEGVPFFIFNHRFAVSGAHDPEVLLSAMLDSSSEFSAANDS